MPTRVAIVTSLPLNRPSGGAQRVIHQALGLLECGFRNFVVFTPGLDPNLPFSQDKLPPVGLGGMVSPFQHDCRLIHAHQNAGLRLDGRVWTDLHGLGPVESLHQIRARPWSLRARALHRFNLWALRRIVRRSERIVCAARSISDRLKERCPILPPVDVINNAVDVGRFGGSGCEGLVVGVIGGFTSRWGRTAFPLALETARLCPGIPFRFVGEISVDQRAAASQVNGVEILGEVDESAYLGFFQTISAVLLPYADWCRGGGARLKLLQAAASALPVVATPSAQEGFAATEVVCVGDDPEDLARCIKKKLTDSEERGRRGDLLRKTIEEHHDHRREGQRLADLYERSLSA